MITISSFDTYSECVFTDRGKVLYFFTGCAHVGYNGYVRGDSARCCLCHQAFARPSLCTVCQSPP